MESTRHAAPTTHSPDHAWVSGAAGHAGCDFVEQTNARGVREVEQNVPLGDDFMLFSKVLVPQQAIDVCHVNPELPRMPIARSIRVTGHVQGVYFREWTLMIAGELGIAGWVRNLKDGSVEIYALGETRQLESFIERLHAGSPASRVDAVHVKPAENESVTGFMRRSSL